MGTRSRAAALAVITMAAAAGCGSTAPASQSGSGSSGSSASSGSPGSGSSSGSSGYGYGSSYGSSSTSGSSSGASASRGATVHVAHTSRGPLLVNSAGFTLYLFTADHGGSDHCVKVSGCTGVWPPLTVSGKPTAGSGVHASLLGTIRLPNGHRQVTYAHHPLYRYTGDGAAASTGYLGFSSYGGTWEGLSPSGSAVK